MVSWGPACHLHAVQTIVIDLLTVGRVLGARSGGGSSIGW